jgi:BRO family, N-terminal domain
LKRRLAIDFAIVGGESWFVAEEIASVLDLSDAGAMTRPLDPDKKNNMQIVSFSPKGTTVFNESGLYTAIVGNSKPQTKPFKQSFSCLWPWHQYRVVARLELICFGSTLNWPRNRCHVWNIS